MAEKIIISKIHGCSFSAGVSTLSATIVVSRGNRGCTEHTIKVMSTLGFGSADWKVLLKAEALRYADVDLGRAADVVLNVDGTPIT